LATAENEDTDHEKQQENPENQRTCVKPPYDWWPKLLCILAICLALLAIVLTLSLHQNKPLPQWPFSISINALLSTYIVVSKSSMLLVLGSGEAKLRRIYVWQANSLDQESAK
jgi:hypothetical protein